MTRIRDRLFHHFVVETPKLPAVAARCCKLVV
jgi:hypothetical protein